MSRLLHRTTIYINGAEAFHMSAKAGSTKAFSWLTLSERMDGHAWWEIRKAIKNEDATAARLQADAKNWLGKAVDIQFEVDKWKRRFKGVVLEAGVSWTHSEGELVLRGYGPTILLETGANTRSFSDQTLAGIFEKVLNPYNKSLLKSEVKPASGGQLPYTVQYKESDFNFLSRLAEAHAEWFFYNGESLHLGKPHGNGGGSLTVGQEIHSLSVGLKPNALNFNALAYVYEDHQKMESRQPPPASPGMLGSLAAKSANEVFTQTPLAMIPQKLYPGDKLEDWEKRKEKRRASALVGLTASSDVPLCLGGKLNIGMSAKQGGSGYGSYFITSIVHRIDSLGSYENHFEAVPVEAPVQPSYPPFHLPLCETQPAIVKENDDPKNMGRVKVNFYWQQSNEMTPWIRQTTQHSGDERGFYFIPEKEESVLLSFEQQNPDRPYVSGSLYHGSAKTEEWKNNNNELKAIKTRRGNQVLFNDKKAEEQLRLFQSPPKDDRDKKGERHNEILLQVDDRADDLVRLWQEKQEQVVNELVMSKNRNNRIRICQMQGGQKVNEILLTLDDEDKLCLTTKGNLRIKAKNIRAEAERDIEVNAGKEIKLSAGVEIAMSAPIIKMN